MTTFTNLDSTAIDTVNINTDSVNIKYTSSDKDYKYAFNNTNAQDFANTMQNLIENGQSVGRFINKSIREDQTLQIVAV